MAVHTGLGSTKEMLASQKHLQNQCEKIWTDVNQIHTDLTREKPLGTLNATENKILDICKAKERQLTGEVEVIKNAPLQVYPTDANTLQVLLQQELKTSTSQLEQTLEVVQTQRKELEEELARERSLLDQHKDVRRSLVQKLEAAKGMNPDKRNSDGILQELTRKRQHVAEIQQELMRKLAHFAGRHFPLPSTADLNKASKRRRSSAESDDDQHRYISLLEILEVLMNKCTEDESDPYITLDESFWPPYIELLLRCGVALRHPQACQRIRLVPFHL